MQTLEDANALIHKQQNMLDELATELRTVKQHLQAEIQERQHLERMCCQQQEQLRLLLDSLPVCIFYVDADQRYQFVNQTYQTWFGVNQDALLGQYVQDMLGKEAYQVIQDKIERVLSGYPITYEAEVPYPHHGTRYVIGTLVPDWDQNFAEEDSSQTEDGSQTEDSSQNKCAKRTVKGYYGVILDISDRKHTEEALKTSEAELRALFAALTDAVVVRDAKGFCLKIAPTNPVNLYKSPPDLLGLTLHDTLPQTQADAILGYIQQAIADEKTVNGDYSLLIDGQEVHFATTFSPLPEDKVILVARDVTAYKQAVTALQDLNWTLEQHIQERTLQLEQANQQLQAEIAVRQRTEEWLQLHRQAIAASTCGIVIADATQPDCPLIYVNPAFEQQTGYTMVEVLGENCRFLQGNDRQQPEIDQMRAAIRQGESCHVTLRNYRKDGSLFWNEMILYPIYDSDHRLTYFVGIQTDVSDRINTEMALKKSSERLRIALEAASMGVWDWNLVTGVETWSPQTEKIFGFSPGEFNHTTQNFYNRIHPDDLFRIKRAHTESLQTGTYQIEYRIIHPDGKICWVSSHGKIFCDSFNRPLRMVGVDMDITERKLSEEQLKGSLREKEVLLKEVHHRVKNNLQMVYSMLNLQASSIRDPQVLTAIKDSQNRVRAMALIHEKLYRSTSLAQIRFSEYVHQLVTDLHRSYCNNPAAIQLSLDIADIELPIDTLIPCGLIISELVSNAIKYAFPGGRSGEISLIFLVEANNQCILTIRDNGVGIPDSIDFQNTVSLGMQLVCALTQQLRGTIALDRVQGSGFKIIFPRHKN